MGVATGSGSSETPPPIPPPGSFVEVGANASLQEPRLPTILQTGPYRFFFYSSDGDEPPHVHVERDNKRAKIWLAAAAIARPGGFKGRELRRIQRIVEDNHDPLISRWNEYFLRR